MPVDEADATWIPSPNYGQLGDASHKKYVILHATAGMNSAANVAYWFANPQSAVSAHYIVGLQGEIVQCVRESEAAWAEGYVSGTPLQGGIGLPVWGDGVHRDPWWAQTLNPNLICISIEHVKPSLDNSDAITAAQQAASFRLIRDVCARWHIPMRPADAQGGITGHYSIDALNRARCPGPYPWQALFAYLSAQNAQKEEYMITIENASNFFTSSPDGNYWQCKLNGFVVGNAILAFYRQYGGSAYCGLTYLGLPLSNEMNAGVGPGTTYQFFERGVLAYDPAHKLDNPPGAGDVYLLKLYEGIGQDPRYVKLLKQYNALIQQINAASLTPEATKAIEQVKQIKQIVEA